MIADFYTKYPQVNDEILNLDWIINKVKAMDGMLTEWIAQAEELRQMLLNTIPGMQSDISNLQSAIALIDANISDLQQIRNDIAALKVMDGDLQAQIDAIDINYDLIFQKFDEVNERIDNIREVIGLEFLAAVRNLQNQLYTVKFDLEQEMNEIKARMDQIDTSVYNPWAGRRVDQDENARLIYADLSDMIPTAAEYSELGLSSNDYNKYDLTAYEYAVRGKKHFNFDWIYSPISGIRQNISNVLTEIMNFLLGTMTASEYAALDLTATEYSNLDLTSEEYYSYNESNEVGLSALDYAAISKLHSNFLRIKEV